MMWLHCLRSREADANQLVSIKLSAATAGRSANVASADDDYIIKCKASFPLRISIRFTAQDTIHNGSLEARNQVGIILLYS